MDDWEKFNETSVPEENDFYIHLNRQDITDADYVHAKTISEGFGVKKVEEYHDLLV